MPRTKDAVVQLLTKKSFVPCVTTVFGRLGVHAIDSCRYWKGVPVVIGSFGDVIPAFVTTLNEWRIIVRTLRCVVSLSLMSPRTVASVFGMILI